jgi:putative ATP-dependent endonuclease of the OLD family
LGDGSYEVKAGPDEEGRTLDAGAKEFLKTTYLKPLRDAKTELIARKNSRLSQILYAHPVFKEKDKHKLVGILTDANEDIKKYFENEEEKDGYIILKTLKTFLSRFLKKDSAQNTRFHIDNPTLKNILEILKLTLQDERSGLGTYNLLFIAAELLNLRRSDYDGLKLGLIEEIEAHLHPQAQLRVVSALEDEAREGGVQLIITTHSPNLASKIKIENLILCHGKSVYPLGKAYTKLKETDYTFLERFLDVTKANLFFAQGVILVEGDAENILIPTISKLIGKDLTSHGVSVVNVGGTSFLRYGSIFKRQIGTGELKMPVAIITDLDVKPDDETTGKTEATRNKQEKYNGQSVKTFVSPHWAFEYCLALSANLKEMIFQAIKSAGQEMTDDGYTGKQVPDDWATFSNGLNNTDLAKKIYDLLLIGPGKKKISKAITAQCMANALEMKFEDPDFITKVKEDETIEYIIQAIEYATSNINN